MSVVFRTTFPPTSDEALTAFEQQIGEPLPADYRSFLLKTNGGEQPDPEGFRVETGEGSMLAILYPVGDGTGYDLTAHFNHMKEELPSGVIPIGQDIGGNAICLAVAGEDTGAVLFMDHEVETGPHEDGWDNLYFCARSFTEFLDGLRD